jgi:hypothetical protein
MPYKANEDRRHKIPRAHYRVGNWAAYDAALRRRGDLTIWVTAEAMDTGIHRPARSTTAILRDCCRDGPDAAAGFWAAVAPDRGDAGLDPASP